MLMQAIAYNSLAGQYFKPQHTSNLYINRYSYNCLTLWVGLMLEMSAATAEI